jgi:hypothetical protein
LTLDPPDATSHQAGVPHLDEDYLILSTIHSAKPIALGTANQIRSHFCRHYKTCEHGNCETCANARREERQGTPSLPGTANA